MVSSPEVRLGPAHYPTPRSFRPPPQFRCACAPPQVFPALTATEPSALIACCEPSVHSVQDWPPPFGLTEPIHFTFLPFCAFHPVSVSLTPCCSLCHTRCILDLVTFVPHPFFANPSRIATTRTSGFPPILQAQVRARIFFSDSATRWVLLEKVRVFPPFYPPLPPSSQCPPRLSLSLSPFPSEHSTNFFSFSHCSHSPFYSFYFTFLCLSLFEVFYSPSFSLLAMVFFLPFFPQYSSSPLLLIQVCNISHLLAHFPFSFCNRTNFCMFYVYFFF